MARHEADVAIIGAGTAGLAAWRAATETGARALLIDPAFRGTTCAYAGCMPSKALIAAADKAEAARSAMDFGIHTEVRIDGVGVMARVRHLRDGFVAGVRQTISEIPEDARLTARARFTGPAELSLDTGDSISARAIVIAAGASPAVPPPFEPVQDKVLTTESLFELKTLPDSLGVIGAGPVGLELAQALSRLGVRVELFDGGEALAGMPGPESEALKGELGFPLHLGTKPQAEPAEGGVRLFWEGGETEVAQLLVAAGRPPNLEPLELEAAGLELQESGVPRHDPDTMQCGDAPLFLAGDVSGARPVLHEASAEGRLAGHNAACFPDVETARRKVSMAITFTRPEAALIGEVPEDGAEGIVTGCVDYAQQGRARVMGAAAGLVRIYARASDGKLVGASLCAPGAEHLAHLLAWSIEGGRTAQELLDLPVYHPTLEEGLQTALRDICQQISAPKPWHRDDADLPGSR
ncbi:dihydrolipoyl dehydrogenase [Pseudoroseicyclus tamaricis]|uniref:Dihydrolipoyl dehydrogenase n=1 Tax=Pseudoroseicyclus tamaricis TaxID=2705421 RepID=A0A6B2JGP6_9RHOB|nr:dihydrolipoyl dehydrogenase [Pseudoroseicyclus tamaricis]NDV00333.1 dihydrolipoyl dehydrogenase [Pseudoroseicyclus tamaricis]